jgi:hypothetical protein
MDSNKIGENKREEINHVLILQPTYIVYLLYKLIVRLTKYDIEATYSQQLAKLLTLLLGGLPWVD